jgi:hypothetical protein
LAAELSPNYYGASDRLSYAKFSNHPAKADLHSRTITFSDAANRATCCKED